MIVLRALGSNRRHEVGDKAQDSQSDADDDYAADPSGRLLAPRRLPDPVRLVRLGWPDHQVCEPAENGQGKSDLPQLAHDATDPGPLNRLRLQPLPRVELRAVRVVVPG